MRGLAGAASGMPGSWNPAQFPKLTDADYTVTSPVDRKYNCIAWAADDATAWWWPDQFNIGKWPAEAPRAETLAAFQEAYGMLGYMRCDNGAHEPGVEKIALYAAREADGTLSPTHAARQLENGNWTSKLGDLEDIEHRRLDSLENDIYGKAVIFLQRPRKAP